MEVSSELAQKLDLAKYNFIRDRKSVFLCNLLFSMNIIWDEKHPSRTAATNGINLILVPSFFEKLDVDTITTVLAHETWHVAFKHMLRCETRNPLIWNMAADYVINLFLRDNNYIIPSTWLCDEQFRDMNSVQVYDELMKMANKLPQYTSFGEAGSGADMDAPGSGQSDPNDPNGQPKSGMGAAGVEAAIDAAIAKACAAAKQSSEGFGNLPGEIEDVFEHIFNPRIPWESIFLNTLTSFAKTDYSYKRQNRRFPDQIIPSLYAPHYGEVVFALDTSGSMTDHQCGAFVTAADYVMENIKPERMIIHDFDTAVRGTHIIENGRSIRKIEFKGRGGTDLEDLFKVVSKKKPLLLVVYSDLDCDRIEKDPGFPVVWICCDNPRAEVNFGRLIHIDTE
jgi:predicted metal-dependent peptidase